MRLLRFGGHIFQVIQRCPSHTNREDGDTYNGNISKSKTGPLIYK
jgi:hypothetical protein